MSFFRFNKSFYPICSVLLLLLISAPSPLPTLPPVTAPAPAEPSSPDIDRSLNLLTQDLDRQLTSLKQKRLAVLDFANLRGQVTGLGQWVAEELITRLFATRRYEIADREYARQVISEFGLARGGLTRPWAIQQFSRLLGSQVVIFGTVSDLGAVIKIHVRLYRTDRGNLLGVATAQLPSTPGLVQLLKQLDPSLQVRPTPSRKPSPTAKPTVEPSDSRSITWAVSARASSEYSKNGWDAGQATGSPNTTACGDFSTAWTSQEPDGGSEWLEVTFPHKVAARAVHVRESFNPGAVVKVEALVGKGASLLWQGEDGTAECPGDLVIKLPEPLTLDKLRITLDTAKVPGWNEIDAVGIVGEKVP